MNKISTIVGLAVAASTMTASADVLLEIDLSVVDQITISATGGLSAASVSGADVTGVLMAGFYNTAAPGISRTYLSGDLVSAGSTPDGSPGLFNSSFGTSYGLNFYSWATESTVDFTAGSVAFTGSATWSLDAASYADAIAGNLSGDIYAFADDDDDIGAATNIGSWAVVPAPSSMALLGLGGIVAGRRRR
tara:strand:- start:140 stop:712 length:573 start_codon:yes stop_codon:yes gene_type:complete